MDSEAMTSTRVKVEDLHVSYGDLHVLNGLNLSVSGGEIAAVIGPSGCGKSTLLRTICSLQKPDSGCVHLDGQLVQKDGRLLFEEWEIARNIMMVPQTPSLLPHYTARRNIEIGLETVLGLAREKASIKVDEVAHLLGIEAILEQYPEELSGGQAQRVQLARALCLQPNVLLLDEVTSSVDPQTAQEVINTLWLLKQSEKQTQQTIIIVTHLLNFAFHFADRILFLYEGVIYEQGSAHDFARSAEKMETKAFIASAFIDGSPNFGTLDQPQSNNGVS